MASYNIATLAKCPYILILIAKSKVDSIPVDIALFR